MRTVFMGTPEFAVPCLRRLAAETEVVGVFTQPDRPQGRGLVLTAPPVKQVALELGLPVYQPPRLREPACLEQLQALDPDLIVVVAYAQLLTPQILSLPPYGCINVHASLLPAYRGGAPIHWAIINGETATGITTMYMSEELDAGDILLQDVLPIGPNDTCGQIHDQLAELGAETLSRTLAALREGKLEPKPQPQEGVSYARNLTKQDGLIDWDKSAIAIHNQVRGLNPWPVAYTSHNGKRLRIFSTRVVETGTLARSTSPGCVIEIESEGPLVQTGDGVLLLQEVQPESKRRMSGTDYARGHALAPGSRLG
ncbi:MAG: methionyl-tRNA formyltransferase [Firmicutes bacterium]|jgi:methionyl-tRNA formyltransferase|nr:methionyl-tRNA formyltransferase [Bacillota bacterium]